MNPHLWWLFFLGTLAICASPGPNMLQVMSCSARYGFKRAFFGMAGCFIPVFLYICISLAGVGALLQAFPAMFNVLRYAGAAYLIYLGMMAWRENPVSPDSSGAGLDMSRNEIFLRSLLVGLSNPKAILFASAYFPQFVDPHAPQGIQFAMLLATFSACEIACYMIYGVSGSRLSRWLSRAAIRRRFNRFTGGLFAFFGMALMAKGG